MISQVRAFGATLFVTILACAIHLNADWDPAKVFDEEINLSALQQEEYIELKKNVMKSLTNSWCSKEKTHLLMDLTLITQPEICVEIGAFTGASVLPVAAVLKKLNHGEIYAIDAWSNEEAVKYMEDNDPNKAWWSTLNMKSIYDAIQSMVQTWALTHCCQLIKSPSREAVNQIDQIDFLHLDGNYSEFVSLQDVNLYVPKVKSGGYILLSNLFTMVNGKQPKIKAFCALLESSEMVAEIERENAILFRKR